MGKPRIIIADMDINYINPLQSKFVEEYFDQIELEIISDKKYFESLFSSPQKVEILIVSEELYELSLLRHNISFMFIMTEHYEEGEKKQQDTLQNKYRINKYTSIKEIFNEIIGKSAEIFNVISIKEKKTKIILVYSASGGVGKTTVAVGISTYLTKKYRNVLYINADRLQTFHGLLEDQSVILETDVYKSLAQNSGNLFPKIKHIVRKEIFNYIPSFKASLMSLGLPYSIFEKIVSSAKKENEYDYIIIDADTIFDEGKANLLNLADKVLIVTEQTKNSVFATNIFVSNINDLSSEKYIFVCNNFNVEEPNALNSSEYNMKFRINYYIEKFLNYDKMNCEDISKEEGIQKTGFLIM